MALEVLLREVVSLLERARQVDKPAEERLAQLNTVEGYRICLLRAATAQELLPDIRLLGAVMLKNGIHQYWGPAAPTSLDRTEEKNMLKSGLLQAVTVTPDKAVSAQLMASIAKIARIEWPEQWPQLVPSLTQLVQASFESGNLQAVHRGLDLMEQVLQELSSKRLPLHRIQFRVESCKLLPALTVIWKSQVETFLGLFRQLEDRQKKSAAAMQKIEKLGPRDVAELEMRCRLSLLLTQCLQWVVVFGIEDPGGNQDVHVFFGLLLQYVKGLSELRAELMTLATLSGEARLALHDSASLVCTTMAEVVLKTQTQHPVSFVPFLGAFVTAFLNIFSESFDPDFPSSFKFEKLSVQALNFLSQVVACDKYGLDLKMDEDAQDEASQKAKDLVRGMITAEVAAKMTQLVVSGFLPLSPEKLTSWEGEPEIFVHEEDVEDVEDGSTAAASGLLWGLVKAYPGTICPLLVNMLGEAIRLCPPGASLKDDGAEEVSRAVLFKEAVYHALSIATVILMEQAHMGLEFNIAAVYRDILSKEISMSPVEEESMGSRIIQRRTILLIGDWIERIPSTHRPTVYQQTLRLLYHSDLLVSMAALAALHNILEEASFDDDDDDEDEGEGDEETLPHPAAPILDASGQPAIVKATVFVGRYCQPICENIFRMIALSEDLNTHEILLDRLRLVISTAGSEAMSVCVPSITQQLGSLWQGSGEEILRAPILRTLSCIVMCLGNRSEALQAILLPLLMECLGHKPDRLVQQAVDSLLNETLRFWRELIHNARMPTEALFSLFERFGPLVERLCASFTKDVEFGSVKAAEDLHLLLSGVLVGYVLLGGPAFMERQAVVIGRVLVGALALQREHDDEDFGVMQALDFLLQIFPQQSPLLFQQVLQECLKHALFLAQQPEASRMSAEEAEMAALVGDTPLIVKYLVLLARLLVVNTQSFLNLLSMLPPAQQRQSLELLLECFVEFTPQMDALQAALTAMATCCLIGVLLHGTTAETSCPWLDSALRLVNKVSRKPLHTPRPLEELLGKHAEKAETEVQRKSALEYKDPVRTVVITQFLADKMRDLPHAVQMQVLSSARSNPKFEDLIKVVGALLGLQQRPATFHV